MKSVWALVTTPVADLRAAPRHAAELVSQRLLGEVLRIEAERGAWLRAGAWDGYPGWVRDWSVRHVSAAAARRWEMSARHLAWGHRVRARRADGSQVALPWGARVVVHPGRARRVELPDGGPARVEGGRLREAVQVGADPRRLAIRLARAMLGVPYHWGGTSPSGFDCSGLVQWAYGLAGVPLPRDAGDQRAAIAAPRGPARPGDLLFFGHGRTINHVAMVTRPPWVIHAYGQVEETRLDRTGRPELRSILLGAGRPWSATVA